VATLNNVKAYFNIF